MLTTTLQRVIVGEAFEPEKPPRDASMLRGPWRFVSAHPIGRPEYTGDGTGTLTVQMLVLWSAESIS